MKLRECPVCGATIDGDVWEYHRAQEDRVIEILKEYNPAWILSDDSCPKAVEHYRRFILRRDDD